MAKFPNRAKCGKMTFAWFILQVFRKMAPKVMFCRSGQEHDFCMLRLKIAKIEKHQAQNVNRS
jgi:hypothetical protein